MVSEDNIVVLLFDSNDATAKIISSCFFSTDVAHQLRRVSSRDAMVKYLQESLLKESSEKFLRPQLIVLHTQAFDKDIESLLDYIKNSTELKRIPVLILSESDDETSIDSAYRLKANSYIVCPGDSEDIEKVIIGVASYWLKWNHLPP